MLEKDTQLHNRVGTIAELDYWTGLLDWTTGLDY